MLTESQIDLLRARLKNKLVIPVLFKDGEIGKLRSAVDTVDGCCCVYVPGKDARRWIDASDLEMSSNCSLREIGAKRPQLCGDLQQDYLALRWAEWAPEWVFED